MINNGQHITELANMNPCLRHNAPLGEPCWTIPLGHSGHGEHLRALCGSRIRRGGYDGQITSDSLSHKKKFSKFSHKKKEVHA